MRSYYWRAFGVHHVGQVNLFAMATGSGMVNAIHESISRPQQGQRQRGPLSAQTFANPQKAQLAPGGKILRIVLNDLRELAFKKRIQGPSDAQVQDGAGKGVSKEARHNETTAEPFVVGPPGVTSDRPTTAVDPPVNLRLGLLNALPDRVATRRTYGPDVASSYVV